MTAPGAELAEAFRRLQAGDAAAALEVARRLALGMAALMLAGFACWRAYLRLARHRARGLPPTLPGA